MIIYINISDKTFFIVVYVYIFLIARKSKGSGKIEKYSKIFSLLPKLITYLILHSCYLKVS